MTAVCRYNNSRYMSINKFKWRNKNVTKEYMKHKTLYSLKWEVVDSQNKVRGDLKLNMSP